MRYLLVFFTICSTLQLWARSEFISYDLRQAAMDSNREDATYYREINFNKTNNIYGAAVDISLSELEREVFFHFEGLACSQLFVNNDFVAQFSDSEQIAEVNITRKLTDGINLIKIIASDSLSKFEARKENFALRNTFIYSQPKINIKDYLVNFTKDSLCLKIIVDNNYNVDDKVSVGYDIYSPKGDLEYYNLRDLKLRANSCDTLVFSDKIPNIEGNEWTHSTPKLYNITLYLRYNGIMSEYINFKLGYKDFVVDKDFDFSVINYNSANNREETERQLRELKILNINTLTPSYPQPYWFYDLCDKIGFYVIDQANINCSDLREDLKIGGTPSNNLDYLNLYLQRINRMYDRGKNRTCIVAWSLGGTSGQGINMYRSYKLLKELDASRPVLYRDAGGEWNSDFSFPNTTH